MLPAPRLSVVLACYNEEEILAASFAEIREVLDDLGRPYEIVFVDDVSRDRTREIIREIVAAHPATAIQVILHDANRGRGATVSDGFRAARGDIVGFLDVDLEVHARYIPSLVRAIEKGAEVATVRRVYAFQIRSLDRYFMSRGYSYLVRKMLGTSLHDTETGYKFFRREAQATSTRWLAPILGLCSWVISTSSRVTRGSSRAIFPSLCSAVRRIWSLMRTPFTFSNRVSVRCALSWMVWSLRAFTTRNMNARPPWKGAITPRWLYWDPTPPRNSSAVSIRWAR